MIEFEKTSNEPIWAIDQKIGSWEITKQQWNAKRYLATMKCVLHGNEMTIIDRTRSLSKGLTSVIVRIRDQVSSSDVTQNPMTSPKISKFIRISCYLACLLSGFHMSLTESSQARIPIYIERQWRWVRDWEGVWWGTRQFIWIYSNHAG